MKPVPDLIAASAPPGTIWYGGTVDRSRMVLRVMSKERGADVDQNEVTSLLGCASDRENRKHWCLHAPEKAEADLDSQVEWILARVTADLSGWSKLVKDYRVDLFCGLFMERPNRGISLLPKTMVELGIRGIELGFDIYSPEK